MAKEIGIRLNFTSTGEQKVITNLNELETELKRLQTELRTLDFGSAAFKQAAVNIQTLKSRIDEVEKSTEGIGAEKKYRALGDAINVATGSFQVLSGVLGLVLTNEEDLIAVQKAEAQALQVLNIALGINAINTAIVESASLRATIALKAQAIATRVATTAQNLYNAAMAANPIGLVIAAVVGLTLAIYGIVKAFQFFTKEVDINNETLKEQGRLETSLIGVKKKAAIELERQLTILTDNIATRNLELKVINDLKKTYPGFNAFVDRNNKLTKDGITFLKQSIELKKAEAALNQIATQQVEAEIKLETQIADIRVKEGFTQRAANQIADARRESVIQLGALSNLEIKYTKIIDNTIGVLEPLNRTLDKRAKAEAKAAEATKEDGKVLDKTTESIIKRTKTIDLLIKELEKLGEAEKEYTTGAVKAQEDILAAQKEILDNREAAFQLPSEKLKEELDKLLFAVVPTENQEKEVIDRYKDLFDTIGTLYEDGVISVDSQVSFDGLLAEALKANKDLKETDFDLLNDKSKTDITEFFNSLKGRIDVVKKLFKEVGFLPENLDTDIKLVKELSKLEDEIFDDRIKGLQDGRTAVEVNQDQLDLIKERLGIEEQILKKQESINTETNKGLKANQEKIEAAQAEIISLENFAQTLLDGIDDSGKFYQGILNFQKLVEKGNEKIAEGKKKITEPFTAEEVEGFINFAKANVDQFDTIVLNVLENYDKIIEKIGKEGIAKLFDELGKEVGKLEGVSREQLGTLIQQLETAIAINKLQGKDTEAAEELLKGLKEQFEKLPTDVEITLAETFDKIDAFAQKFARELGQIQSRFQSILQSQSSLFLESLARDEEAALRAIEGSGARLEKEQAAVKAKFAKARFEAEKKARIQELNFTLAQVISDTALAITSTLANVPFPANLPLSVLIGGLATAQGLQVRNQLTFAKSQQFVGRRGGLIVGQSHEGSMGGVPTLLEGGEFVVNKAAVSKYGDLIGELNSSTGGRKLTIDDSRIVQTIASQNQNTPPLKAFVLFQDIQNTEKLNKRITQLSRL